MTIVPGVCTLVSWCNGGTPDRQSGGMGSYPGCTSNFSEKFDWSDVGDVGYAPLPLIYWYITGYETWLLDLSPIVWLSCLVVVSPHIWSWVWTCMAGVCTLVSWCNGSTQDRQSGGIASCPGWCIKLFREVWLIRCRVFGVYPLASHILIR